TSFLIGDGTGKGETGSHYFAFEACEYRRHFLAYEPDYCIITNIDFDHPDYFHDIDDVVAAFQMFANQVHRGIIACGDDDQMHSIKTSIPMTFYGLKKGNDIRATNVHSHMQGTTFDVMIGETTFYETFT